MKTKKGIGNKLVPRAWCLVPRAKKMLAAALCAVGLSAFAAEPVAYLDWDDVEKKMTNATCTAYEVVTNEMTVFDLGKTYAVTNDVTVSSRITVNGTVESPTRLILCDGAKLTAQGGVKVTVSGATTNALVICGQVNGTGALEATGGLRTVGIGGLSSDTQPAGSESGIGGMVTINGGTVTATGGNCGAGIGGGWGGHGGTVTINGGTVTAKGGNSGAGIGGGLYGAGGNVSINGGTVTATAGTDGGEAPTVAIGCCQWSGDNGTVTFGAGKWIVKQGDVAPGADTTAEAYAADHSAKYAHIEVPRPGSEDDPWKVGGTDGTGDLVEAWTNGTGVLTVQGAGSVTNLADVIADWADIKGGITAINVTSNGVTGAEAQAFAGLGVPTPVALTLPDGWQGELPDDGGNWYGAKVNPTGIPLAVKNVTFQQRWPWNGKVDIGFGVTGPEGETNVVITVKDGETEVTNFTAEVTIHEGGVLATNLVWDAATAGLVDDFKSDDVTVEVAFAGGGADPTAPVQLWAGGPYFATCNVGANTPEEYGWYFWWGDTVGYTNSGSAWVSVADGTTTIQFSGSDPTATNTCKKTNAELKSLVYIDDDANPVLNAEHDAAKVKLGDSWRMMTKAELDALTNTAYCTAVWTDNWNNTGVKGYIVTGNTSGYTDKSIFLPAAGYGIDSHINNAGMYGCYWSSTPDSVNSNNASCLAFSKSAKNDGFRAGSLQRYYGYIVRAVRDTPPEDTPAPVAPVISAKSAAGTVDLRTAVALDAGEVTVADVSYSDTAWGSAADPADVTLGYTNETTGAVGELKTGLSGGGAAEVDLPKKDGDYLLTHSTGDLKSFVTFTVSGFHGTEGDPWEIGANAAADVIAFSNGTGTVFFDPARGTVTKAGLEMVTNAMGDASFAAKLVSEDGTATNDLVMVLGASGTAYDTIEDALAANEASYTLFEVGGYFVSYDGNGAAGTMAMDTFIQTIPTNLTANAYTAVGYAFAGWTTNGSDTVAYTNRHEGVDFAQPGETLALKAKWTVDPAGVKPADFAALTAALTTATNQAASLPVTVTLTNNITVPQGGVVKVYASPAVTFAGTGKFDVTAEHPALFDGYPVGTGLKPEDLGRFVTDKDVKAYYEAEGGKVVLRARGESEDFPWELGEAGVEAWMDGDTLLARPERGTASVASLQSVTNALGKIPSPFKVISVDGTATNEVQMLLGSNGKAYDTLAELLAADPLPETVRLFEVKGYWVSYDRGGNDGKGEPQPDPAGAIPDMDTDMFIPTVTTNLTANAYVRTNFVFDCWLGWTNGVRVTYLDGAEGVDFCEPGATLALTAQWTRVAVPLTVTNLANTTVTVWTNGVELTTDNVETNEFGDGTSVYLAQTNADVTVVYRAVAGYVFRLPGKSGTVVIEDLTYGENDSVLEGELPTVVALSEVLESSDTESVDSGVVLKHMPETADGIVTLPYAIGEQVLVGIAPNAFKYCVWLKELDCSAATGLKDIGAKAFAWCSGLEKLTLPASLTTVSSNALELCSSLTEVVLPASLDTVGAYAFSRCYSLTNVEFKGTCPTLVGGADADYSMFYGVNGFALKVPEGWTKADVEPFFAGKKTWQKVPEGPDADGVWRCELDQDVVTPTIMSLRVMPEGGKVKVTKPIADLFYRVDVCTDLASGNWMPGTAHRCTVAEATAGTLELEYEAPPGGTAFFRVTVSEK